MWIHQWIKSWIPKRLVLLFIFPHNLVTSPFSNKEQIQKGYFKALGEISDFFFLKSNPNIKRLTKSHWCYIGFGSLLGSRPGATEHRSLGKSFRFLGLLPQSTHPPLHCFQLCFSIKWRESGVPTQAPPIFMKILNVFVGDHVFCCLFCLHFLPERQSYGDC